MSAVIKRIAFWSVGLVLFVLIFIVQAEKRHAHLLAKQHGMRVSSLKTGLFSTSVTFDRRSPPQDPDFITWKKWRGLWGMS